MSGPDPLVGAFRLAVRPSGFLVAMLLLPASAAQGQRLLTLVEGAAAASSAGDMGPLIGPVPVAVDVDLELLRSAPSRLEIPALDGGVMSAERSVFKDRGGGDLMWSGGQPEAGYDTVVLTVEGGRLVGRFGAAGGGAYQIHAERDGRGGMAPIVGPRLENWCGVHADSDEDHAGHLHGLAGASADAPAGDPPVRASDPQGRDRLDILVLYTAKAAENWADRGGAHAAIRHAGDYLKMVFRNNSLPVEPRIVHIAQASAALDRVGRDVGRHMWKGWGEERLLGLYMDGDGDRWRLPIEHRADMTYLFIGENPRLHGDSCGRYDQLTKGDLDRLRGDTGYYTYAEGWSTNYPYFCGDYAAVFVHEIGHGLGAQHDPENIVPAFRPRPWEILNKLVRPYAKGYVNDDVMPTLGTAMSYRGQIEPFFSSARIRPFGGVAVGMANAQDNERTLRETAPVVARFDDYLQRESPYGRQSQLGQPTNLQARFVGASVQVSWQDNAPDADVHVLSHYRRRWGEHESRQTYHRVEGRAEALIPLAVPAPGVQHEFEVWARRGDVSSLRSNEVVLVFPGDPVAAPSDVSVTLDPSLSTATVRWADNSENEAGFDVQLLRDGEPILRSWRPADATEASFYGERVPVRHGAEYGVRGLAFNAAESGSSETVTFRWDHPLALPPITDLRAAAIGPTTVRVSWKVHPDLGYYRVQAKLRDWETERVWHRSRYGSATTGSVDFEGLAPGGRYTFAAYALENSVFSFPSEVYLTLGERGPGPPAPSGLSVLNDGYENDQLVSKTHLSWKDNSSHELGFEIQVSSASFWRRLATVPPDSEFVRAWHPVRYGSPSDVRYRVFAYNERGFSLSSPLAPPQPPPPDGYCGKGENRRCLRNSRFRVTVDWWEEGGAPARALAVNEGTDDSGLFYFFDPSNWEILVKVVDGCEENGHMWVLGASTTDLGYRIEVIDTATGERRDYGSGPGQPAPAIVDTEAFGTACVDGGAGR